MDNYFFNLVCVDDTNVGFCVLEEKNFGNLEEVHKYVEEHISKYTPERIKWILYPKKKDKFNNIA